MLCTKVPAQNHKNCRKLLQISKFILRILGREPIRNPSHVSRNGSLELFANIAILRNPRHSQQSKAKLLRDGWCHLKANKKKIYCLVIL